MYRTQYLAAALVVFVLTVTPGCHRSPDASPKGEGNAAVAAVPTAHATPQTLTRQVQQPGWIRAYEQTPIYSKITGYVQEVRVDINSRIKKGDLLIKLFVPEMEQDYNAKVARVAQAEAEVKQAGQALAAAKANLNTAVAIVSESEAGIEKASAEFERWSAEFERGQRLFKASVYDEQTLNEARNQMKQSKAGVLQAQARLKSSQASQEESKARLAKAEADLTASQAREQVAVADREQSQAWLNYRELRAPYDGIVTARNVHTGHFLQVSSSGSTNLSAEPLLVVMRTDKVRVNAQIPEYDAVLIKQGMPAVVRFPGTTIPEHKGSVTIDSYAVDDQARTLRTEIHLPSDDGLLRPGLFVNVAITVELPDTLVLPAESLLNEGDSYYCYIVEGGKAVRTAVQVGVKNDKQVQVLRRQERHIGDPKSDKWEVFTGKEEIVAVNPAAIIDGQPIATTARK